MSTHFEIATEIHAAPEQVWAVLVDVEHWPEWTRSVTKVERLDHGPFSVGSRARVRQPKLLPAVYQVTEFDQARGIFNWVSTSPGVRVLANHAVEKTADGSRAVLSVDFAGIFGPLLGRVTRSLTERYVTMEANGLKARSES